LAVRYKRAAFPDEFDRRLRKATKLAESLEKIVKRVDSIVSADKGTGRWKHLKLVDAMAISEEDLTVHRAKRLQQGRVEHITLKPDAGSATPLDLSA
jgi:hypothetical protein